MALWRIVRDAAGRHPDRVALTAGRSDYTYAELDDLVERVAAGLRFQGLAPGDRVVTFLGNTAPHLALLLGCFRAGLVAVPLAPRSVQVQVRYAVRHTAARGIVAPTPALGAVLAGDAGLVPDVPVAVGDPNPPRPLIPWEVVEAGPGPSPSPPGPAADHLALIVFTSGTTCRPKAVVHSQDRLARRAELFAGEAGLTAADVAFVAAPVGRPVALVGQVLATFRAGGRVVLHEGAGPGEFWAGYAAGPPKTFVFTNPGPLAELLTDPRAAAADHAGLRLWVSGGDGAPAGLHARFRAVTGRPLVEMCGLTEAGPYAINPPAGPPRVGSIGRPMRGVDVRLVGPDGADVPPGQAGEVLLRTPSLMVGYWNDTAGTFRAMPDGWLRTGDLARADGDGFLWFAGRAKDQICRGGAKVAPPAVEAALAGHPAVAGAVVVGAPAAVGQAPFAFLALKPGAARPADPDLRAWLADRLDPPSIPDGFAVVDDWPRTYEGKIDRARLGWMAANGGRPV